MRIFNEKEVDELLFLDIDATAKGIDYAKIKEVAAECFMPVCYGGGVSNLEEIRKVLSLGIEKVAINTQALKNPELIKAASDHFGVSTIVVSVDVKKNIWGKYEIYNRHLHKTPDLVDHVKKMEKLGAGEIIINSVDNDGVMNGYDFKLLSNLANTVDVPVIACGGAGKNEHLKEAIEQGASAVAAGSLFVFYGKHRAVLINYPSQNELSSLFVD